MKPIGMKEMNLIFSVTDEMDIHREVIEVPLIPKAEGSVRLLPSGKFDIVIPETIDLMDWLPTMKDLLIELGGND